MSASCSCLIRNVFARATAPNLSFMTENAVSTRLAIDESLARYPEALRAFPERKDAGAGDFTCCYPAEDPASTDGLD